MAPLESLPSFNSYHKYELPANHLLPQPAPRNAVELLKQIEYQLFALCYNVENFLNLPKEKQIPRLNSSVWEFLHEVLNHLPRMFDSQEIDEAR